MCMHMHICVHVYVCWYIGICTGSTVLISGMVTFIAINNYMQSLETAHLRLSSDYKTTPSNAQSQVFSSWAEAYSYADVMDWLLPVPLLLLEIVLVVKLPEAEASKRAGP